MSSSLDAIVAAGTAAWPDVRLDRGRLAARLDAQGHTISAEHAADFFLACACAEGVPEAVRALDTVLTRDVARAIARIDANGAFIDDALQELRQKLLTGDAPKIAEYAGRSALRRWLATAAVRTALNLRRGKDNERKDALISAIGDGVAAGPELEYLRERYKDAFEEGLRIGLATLTDRERVLLKMNLVERLGVDRLSRVYACGRTTVARWLSTAREKLNDAIRAHLRGTLGLTGSEIESIAAVIAADLDVSIVRLLEA